MNKFIKGVIYAAAVASAVAAFLAKKAEEEREERVKALEEALKIEEEGKEL